LQTQNRTLLTDQFPDPKYTADDPNRHSPTYVTSSYNYSSYITSTFAFYLNDLYSMFFTDYGGSCELLKWVLQPNVFPVTQLTTNKWIVKQQ